MERVVKPSQWLLRTVVQSPLLEEFRSSGDVACGDMFHGGLGSDGGRVGLDDSLHLGLLQIKCF